MYFNAGFVKPTLYNIFLYIFFSVFIDAIKPNVEKKLKLVLFLARLFSGGQLKAVLEIRVFLARILRIADL
jgi:hypothetical protein